MNTPNTVKSEMKYPDDYINKVICGDCLEVMKCIPDKSVDLVLTDPPYGIGIDGQKLSISKNPKHNRKEHEFMGWDKKIPSREYFNEMFRISRNQIIFGANYFVDYLTEGHKGWIVWDKGQHGLTMSDGELIYTSFDKPLRIIILNRVELLKDGALHPTQKPSELVRKILNIYSKESDVIIDPFLGSGTTAWACKQLNRKYIGIEINHKYCEIAERRLAQEYLF